MILTAHNPRRRSWRMIPQVEPLSARQVRNCCVIGCVAGMVAIPLLCWVVDCFTI